MKNIMAIIGSASQHSANEKLIDYLVGKTDDVFKWTVFNKLKTLPHFDPELSTEDPPQLILQLRASIHDADGIVICTPEYVFSIPSGLKNAIEWCVATTVFSDKPTGLITASASGIRGHDELKMIMGTVMARFTEETTLLIQGIKGKVNQQGHIIDTKAIEDLDVFIDAFKRIV